MSAANVKMTYSPLLLLLGALAFNLSSLPGISPVELAYGSTDLRSTASACTSKIERDGEGTCTIQINTGKGRAEGKVTIKKESVSEDSETDATFSVSGVVSAGSALEESSEIDCDSCVSKIRESGLKSLEAVMDAVEDQARTVAENARMAQREADLQRRIDRCELTESERPIADLSLSKAKCVLNKLSKKTDDEAQVYYDEVVKAQILNLLNANNPSDPSQTMMTRAQGVQLLNLYHETTGTQCKMPSAQNMAITSLEMSEVSPDEYVAEATCELKQFGIYNYKLAQGAELKLRATTPEQHQYIDNSLNQLKGQWGNYFQSRGLEVQQNAGYYAPALQEQTYDFNNILAQNLKSILASHKTLIEGETAIRANDQQSTVPVAGGGTADQVFRQGGRPVIGSEGVVVGVDTATRGAPTNMIQLPQAPPPMPQMRPGGRAPRPGSK